MYRAIALWAAATCLTSCSGDSGCGRAIDSYIVRAYSATSLQLDYQPVEEGTGAFESYFVAEPVTPDTQVAWQNYRIQLDIDTSVVNSGASGWTLSLFPTAYACSPVANYATEQRVASFSITSSRDLNQQHPAGSELNSLFAAVAYEDIYSRLNYFDQPDADFPALATLEDYESASAPAPRRLVLRLLEMPQPGEHQFSVEVQLEDGSLLEAQARVNF